MVCHVMAFLVGSSQLHSTSDILKSIQDPEFPQTLEELEVLSKDSISVDQQKHLVIVIFTPTTPTCSLCMLIGLSIKVKLTNILPPLTKIFIQITPGSHDDEASGLKFYIIILRSRYFFTI